MDFTKMIQGMKEKEAEEPKQQPKPAFVFPNDPTDPDLERSYGPNVKSVAYRGEDIAKAKEAGWSDDDIYEALEEQDYNPDEILEYMTNYDPKRFKDPKTNPARSVEAWKAQQDEKLNGVREQFPKFIEDLKSIHKENGDRRFDEDAIRDNIHDMGEGLEEDEIDLLTKELSKALEKEGFENETKHKEREPNFTIWYVEDDNGKVRTVEFDENETSKEDMLEYLKSSGFRKVYDFVTNAGGVPLWERDE